MPKGRSIDPVARVRRSFRIALALSVALLLGASNVAVALPQTHPRPWLIVVGDSWAGRLTKYLRSAPPEHFEVHSITQGSARAAGIVNNEFGQLDEALTNVSQAPPGSVVVVTLGSSDIGFRRLRRQTHSFEEEMRRVRAGLDTLVERVLGTSPNVGVLLGGYDILPIDGRPLCSLEAQLLLGTAKPTVLNGEMGALFEALRTLADGRERVEVLESLGTLQGRPGDPDLNTFSPGRFQDGVDCHHPNTAGAALLADVLVSGAERAV